MIDTIMMFLTGFVLLVLCGVGLAAACFIGARIIWKIIR